MNESKETISVEEAKRQVFLVSRRLGLLHLAFAEVLERELGSERGRKLLTQAIEDYSKKIGDEKRERALALGKELSPESFFELSDLPSLGMHDLIEEVEVDGEIRTRAHGCVMGKVWNEKGKGELGRYYCLVDPASCMSFNPNYKFIHTKAIPDGDPYCELVVRPTTEKDRQELESEDTDWSSIEQGS